MYLYLKNPLGDILETYKFEVKYNPKGDKVYETTCEPPEVKLQIISFFEIIRSLGFIEKLENDTYPEVQLLYNEGK